MKCSRPSLSLTCRGQMLNFYHFNKNFSIFFKSIKMVVKGEYYWSKINIKLYWRSFEMGWYQVSITYKGPMPPSVSWSILSPPFLPVMFLNMAVHCVTPRTECVAFSLIRDLLRIGTRGSLEANLVLWRQEPCAFFLSSESSVFLSICSQKKRQTPEWLVATRTPHYTHSLTVMMYFW